MPNARHHITPSHGYRRTAVLCPLASVRLPSCDSNHVKHATTRISLDPEGICVFIFAHIRAQQAIPKKFRNIVDPAGGRSMYA